MDINLNLNQLKFIRGVLSLKRCYKPYEERGDTNVPKGVLWNDDLEDLFIQVEAAIQRQSPNCPPWSPYGSFSTIIKESSKLNEKMTNKTLTQQDFRIIQLVFSNAAALDIDTKLVDDGDFTYDQFSAVWDKVIDLGGDD
jgi:hypothetical protein|tara:strand:- start:205 stop:624 length:420 start_codon:yes stop_codon:yes gene_type:complete